MGTLKDKEAVARFNKKQKELNSLPAIDYEAVNQTKWEYYRLLFRQDGEKTLSSKGFKEFFDANKEWLQPYAVYGMPTKHRISVNGLNILLTMQRR